MNLMNLGITELLLIVVPFGLIFGLIAMMIYDAKGKPKSTGFALGFLLGIIGVIIALVVKGERKRSPAVQLAPSAFQPNPAYYVAGAGAALVVLGSFLPWASVTTVFGTVSVNGIDRDGLFTLGFGVMIGIGVFLTFKKPGKRAWGAGFFALLAIILGVIDLVDASTKLTEASSEFALGSVGIGLYLVVLGGVLGLASFSRNPDAPKEARTRRCPQCAETIKAAARVCRYCGYEFLSVKPAVAQANASAAGARSVAQSTSSASGPPRCPEHNVEMVIRIAVKGPNEGKRFYVCPKYKTCQQLTQIDS